MQATIQAAPPLGPHDPVDPVVSVGDRAAVWSPYR